MIFNIFVFNELQFEAFYAKQFNGRKLTWLHHLSTCDVKVSKYLKRTYIITMQTFQIAVLIQFESSDRLTIRELAEATHLNEDQLGRHILSLTECKLLEVVGGVSVQVWFRSIFDWSKARGVDENFQKKLGLKFFSC